MVGLWDAQLADEWVVLMVVLMADLMVVLLVVLLVVPMVVLMVVRMDFGEVLVKGGLKVVKLDGMRVVWSDF